jgi:UDP-N-acetylmuramate dehydrogenase
MRVANLTTFGLGGDCQEIILVTEPAELLATVTKLQQLKTPYRLIAGGSNVVWQDAPFSGAVIKYAAAGKLNQNVFITGQQITCDTSVHLMDFINLAIKNNLAGLESLSGIPGTVGGAVVGNAGAYGQGISDTLISVEVWDGQKVRTVGKKQCQFRYRDSLFKHKNWLVLRATFKLQPGDKKLLTERSKEIIKIRTKKYPPNLKCPGSFFKNFMVSEVPKAALKKLDPTKIVYGKIAAGYLLEEVGARGMKQGGVEVASYHGNLIINTGRGTTKEVKKLVTKLKAKVKKRFGLNLVEEVRYLP